MAAAALWFWFEAGVRNTREKKEHEGERADEIDSDRCLVDGLDGVPNGIGAGTQGSQNYAVNAGLAKFLTDELGMNVRVQAYGAAE